MLHLPSRVVDLGVRCALVLSLPTANLCRTLESCISGVIILEKNSIVLDRVRGHYTYGRSDVVHLLTLRAAPWHTTQGEATRIASNGMVPSLPHPVGRVQLLLTNLCVREGFVLIRLLLLTHHLGLGCHASVGLRHAVDVLVIQEVVYDLVTVLIAGRLSAVRAQYTNALIGLVEGALRYDYGAALSERGVLHGRLHTASMLALDAQARHGCPFLVIEVYLLLPRVGQASDRHPLASRADANLLGALIPRILR